MQKDITIDVHIDEDDSTTTVTAILDLRGDHFEGRGTAKRNPTDRPMPVIGEELALARALQVLTAEVMDGAQTKIDDFLAK
jgi:hypothetical protein